MARKVGSCEGKRKKKLNQAQKKPVPPVPIRTEGQAIAMLEAATCERSELGKRHRKGLRRVLGVMFRSAQILSLDRDQWFDFTRHSLWKGRRGRPKETDQKDAFDFVARFFVGFNGTGATNKVHLIKRALRPAFDEGVPARNIPKLLRTSGGISGLAKKHRDEEKAGQVAADSGQAPPPAPKIVLKPPSPEFAGKIKHLSRHGAMRVMVTAEAGEDSRIFLTVAGVKPTPKRL